MNTKRIAFMAMLLGIAGLYSVAVAAETVVSTAAQLMAALDSESTSGTHIHISQDIDMSGYKCGGKTFYGTLEGEIRAGEPVPYLLDANGNQVLDNDSRPVQLAGHRITGLKDCLLNSANGAVIRNMVIEKANFEAGGGTENPNGLLSRDAENTTFSNLLFDGCTITDGNVLDQAPNYSAFVAGKATRCKLQAISVNNSNIETGGCLSGLLAGMARGCEFELCLTDPVSSIYGAGAADARTGGLCGDARNADSTPCKFTACVNNAFVTVGKKGDRLGGIVGCSAGSAISNCQNYGLISHVADKDEYHKWQHAVASVPSSLLAARIADLQFQYAKLVTNAIPKPDTYMGVAVQDLESSTLPAQISTTAVVSMYLLALEIAWLVYEYQDPDEVGGICGYANGGSVIQCVNGGYIHSRDAYAGGIVGLGENGVKISHCLNRGIVIGNEQTGGIVGRLEDGGSTISGCINAGCYYAEANTKGPIYGELADGAQSLGGHYSIGTADGAASASITTVCRQTLASGSVAAAMNTAAGDTIWHQQVGSAHLPMPFAGMPLVGTAGNAVNSEVDLWVEVSTFDEFKAAVGDSWAYVRLMNDIELPDNTFGLSIMELPFRGVIDGQNHTIRNIRNTTVGQNVPSTENHSLYDKALFNYADGATFKNIFLGDICFLGSYNNGALVANSKNCTYDNVTLGHPDDKEYPYIASSGWFVGGMVGVSSNDLFTDCQTQITGEHFVNLYCDGFSSSSDANAGGLVGGATGSTFVRCRNWWTVVADDDRVGGIVGTATNCIFEDCRNYGYVHHENEDGSDDELGGIAGYASRCTFSRCQNDGKCIGGDAYIGGIAGYAENGTAFNDCLYDGFVQGDEQTGAIVGYADGCRIRNCLVLGTVKTDNGDETVTGFAKLFGEQENSKWSNNYIRHSSSDPGSGGRALVTADQLKTGQVAWWLNESNSDITTWRQNLTGTSPDPAPVLDKTHDVVTSGSFTNIFIINNETDLLRFAAVVRDQNASQSAVLAADIRLSDTQAGLDNWSPVGYIYRNGDNALQCDKAYSGVFMGNGHTISNIQINSSKSYLGFFGALTTGAVVMDLTVEGSIRGGTGSYGLGGIAGAAESKSSSIGTVQILRCGNKANISTANSGSGNAGGIIGAVYTSEDLQLQVTDCWNTGNVSGGESAAICGSVKKTATFENCWNTGSLNGGTDAYPFVRPSNVTQNLTLTNCYQIESQALNSQESKVKTFTAAQMADGTLCSKLNGGLAGGDNLAWQQNLGTDSYPVLGSNGLYHTRTMSGEYEYGTVCVPFTLTSSDDFDFYTLSSADEGSLIFCRQSTVPAGTPCLVHRLTSHTDMFLKAGLESACTAPLTMQAVGDYRPAGTYSTITGKTDCYYISGDQFWYASKAVTIPACRAWFENLGGAPSKTIAISLGFGGTNSIVQPENDSYEPASEAVIDLSGRRYEPGTPFAPGIYIIDGRKHLVR